MYLHIKRGITFFSTNSRKYTLVHIIQTFNSKNQIISGLIGVITYQLLLRSRGHEIMLT